MIYFICASQLIIAATAFLVGRFTGFDCMLHYVIAIALCCVVFYAVWLTYEFLSNMRNVHARLKLAKSFLSISSEVDEILVMDASFAICYAKHWPIEPNNRDFSFESLIRPNFVDHDDALDRCKLAIEYGTYFEDVFQTVKTNDRDDDCYIRIRVAPLYTNATTSPTYRAIILSNITLYRSEKTSSEELGSLEQYVDAAPFGLVYVNTKGLIVGLNETLRAWLNVSKEQTVGKHISMISSIPSGDIVATNGKLISTPSESEVLNWVHITLYANAPGAPYANGTSYANAPAGTLQEGAPLSHKNRVAPKNKAHPFSVWLLGTKISDDYYALTLLRTNHPISEDFLSAIPIPSFATDKTGCIKAMNPVIKEKYEIKLREHFGEYLDDVSKQLLDNVLASNANITTAELKFTHIDVTVMTYINKWKSDEFIFQLVDTSDQKKLEQQFIQAQKTQAVGQLAGGIAHDFNNLLTAMIGYSDMLLQRIMPNDPSYADIMQIKQNANRASNLVKQLLAFSRRQSLQPRTVNLITVLSDLSVLLRRLIGSKITLKLTQDRVLWSVKVDPVQFEQVVINLVVNARDAMPNGGNLYIESSNYTVQSNSGASSDSARATNSASETSNAPSTFALDADNNIPAGEYVMIQVTDTGCGIPKELVASIFEPFFSTKALGHGTGLGLATAYGIVKQTGGHICVESEVGKGTTFRILLPRCKDEEDVVVAEKKLVQDVTGTETVLLVEDDDAVRTFASRALRNRGYRVIEATNGQAALECIKEGATPDILVTDVCMPEIDGPTLEKQVNSILPDVPIIFVSGYAEETFRRNLSENKSMHFLAKPFTLRELASKVREILDKKKL